MDATTWNNLMDRVLAEATETAEYTPGQVLPPGSGSEGGDPNGLRYANLGPLAFVLCEGLDSAVTRGIDRDTLIAEIAKGADDASVADVEAVLAGETQCPPFEILSSFGQNLAIDLGIILDAASRGGCTHAYPQGPTDPPGY